MTHRFRQAAATAALVAAGIVLSLPEGLLAQGGDGFLFRQPRVTLEFETGYGFQRARSDIFDFVISEHFLDRSDFSSPYVGGEVSLRLTERWDVGLGVGYQSSSTLAESREFIGTDDLPIESITELRQVPVIAQVRYYLEERGRRLGRFAWVPRSVTPFVGVGVGLVPYRFEQVGDFVDEETLDIFFDRFVTDRVASLVRVGGGLNVTLNQQFFVTAEARYSLARGTMAGDFVGFDKIDLDGLQLVAGIAVRF